MIYLDNAATTQMWPSVLKTYGIMATDHFANPNAIHRFGSETEKIMEAARQTLAHKMGVLAEEFYFTPSATYANNLAILGVMKRRQAQALVTTEIEHASVLNTAKALKDQKDVTFIPVDRQGFVDREALEASLKSMPALVSIHHVNNETGTIQDIQALGQLIKTLSPQTLFHVDGVQGFGKVPLDIKRAGIDLFSISGHKVHGPKGIGALYVSKGLQLQPLTYGGDQEKGLVPGTQDVPAMAAFAEAVRLLNEDRSKVQTLKDRLWHILSQAAGVHLVSPSEDASPYILNVGFEGIRSEVLVHALEQEEIYVASGSACAGGAPSHVIAALKVPRAYSDGCIRFSFTEELSLEDIQKAGERTLHYVNQIRKVMKWKEK